VARLGDRLVLCHRHIGASGTGGHDFDVGAYERDEIVLFEVDGGACARIEIFADDHLGDALVALYVRYATTVEAGPQSARAAAVARTIATAVRPPDVEAWCATIADAFELVDHRLLGMGSLRGGEAMRANFRAMFDLEERQAIHADDVLAARPDAVLVRLANSGVARDSGGTYERWFLQLVLFDRDGRIVHMEYFDGDRDADALARFEELTAGAELAAAEPFANGLSASAPPSSAARASELQAELLAARDWQRFRTLVGPGFVYEDRSRKALVRGDVETWITSLEFLTSLPDAGGALSPIGQLGDRILVEEFSCRGDGFAIHKIRLLELDADGRTRTVLLFDPEDRAQAMLEALERFSAGEGASAPGLAPQLAVTRSFLERDWEAMRDAVAPELVFEDQRVLGLGTLGRDAWIASMRAIAEMAPDAAIEMSQVLAWNRHGIVVAGRWFGTRDGGPFESVFTSCFVARDGRAVRIEAFPITDGERAVARFDELCAALVP
jgi:ketosteroid isomerase-like protein